MAESRRSCASCGAPNEEDARFCEGCGTSLARICTTCGVEANAAARFCRGCGAPLDQPTRVPDAPDAGPVRKTVTVMFADLAGSTSFEERVDAETAREVIGNYHDLLRTVAHRHRAGVTKYIGDGFMAVWGVPEIGPEDAVRAVDSAVELQERFVELASWVIETHGVELALRVAVNTGEVVVGVGDADLVGDALNVCARLESECPRGHVVVGEETWRATRGHYGYESLGEVQVKGRSAAVAVYQWLGRQSESADAAPFVGRLTELGRLQSALNDAVTARSARLVTVVGDPGVGKSRIAAQFTGAQRDTRVIEARCDPEGTVAMAPLIEVLRTTDLETEIPASVSERDRLIRDLAGLAAGEAGSVEENFWALRRFVEVLATARPVVLVLDDIQWADALLLDFIEHLVEWVADVPVFVLALARPELRELRPDLGTVGRFVSEAVHLDGLDPTATAELAANVLGAARLPDELVRRLPSSTGGNPLFVRELVGMLAHDGVLIQARDSWRLTIDVDAIAVPPTIHALLASRLERLDGADRRVLEIASVVGSEFSIGALRALARSSDTGVTLSLNRLRRLELAQPSGTYVGDEPVWRFHHVLIRDVAYRRLLKSDRADLHERLADWVETGGPSVAFDSDEMVARHLEAAYTYRHQLGALDDRARELAVRSARHYAASAKRALDRDELVSAGTQAARGAALAAADEALQADLLLVACEAFLSAGDVAAGAPMVDELERLADDALAPWATCYRCQFVVYTDPERLFEVETRLHEAIDEFSRRRDHAGLAKAHRVRAGARGRLGRIGDSETDLFEALIAARQSGDHRQITAALGAAPGAALWGPSPVPKAGGRCLDVVRMQRMTTAAPSLEATSLRHLAVLELLRGRPDKARTMLTDARQVVADLGLRHGVMETELFAGIIESMEGDPVAAEPHFRTALEGLDALGVGADAGQAAALLARSVLAQGRLDEADRYAAESERLAGRNLKTAIAWRAVRAEILAAQGHHADAVAMARDSVAVAAGTDLVLDHAEACLALGRVLALAGDTNAANNARDDAEALYAAKEVTMRVGQVPESAVSPAAAVQAPTVSSRLPLANRATDAGRSVVDALHRSDIDAVIAMYSDTFTYDDRRRSSGDPINGLESLRAATARILEHYGHFEMNVLAVRGEHLALASSCLSDNSGNEATDLIVTEIDEGGLIIYEGRFDDDFEGAYRELDRRYYTGEGAQFSEPGGTTTEWTLALNRADYATLFNELTASDFRIENRSHSAFPDRSIVEYRATLEELDARVVSTQGWSSSICWLSQNWCVARCERESVGEDGEQYAWQFLIAFELRDGRVASMCEFEVDDEDRAFAFAEDRVNASNSRLRISNRASELAGTAWQALQAHDVDALHVDPSEDFVYDDRRLITGDPIEGAADLHAATKRILVSYPHTEWRTMAVRGERLEMHSSRQWDDNGNEARTLNVMEFDDAGRLSYFGRFEEDDFEGAYRELDRRYYANEGALFAESGSVATEWVVALNRGDYAKAFGELSDPDAGFENRSRSAFPDPSVSDPRATYEDLTAMVGSTRTWPSALCILSPTLAVGRLEQEAVGPGGERYLWTWIIVTEMRDGRFGAGCLFELGDEEAAFAYAEERLRSDRRRLAVINKASESFDIVCRAMRNHDADGAARQYSEPFVYEDHRRLSGGPVNGVRAMRAGIALVCKQYPHLEWHTLAVRGEHLELRWARQWDDAGNETSGLMVIEVDVESKVVYQSRFDEDDLEGASRELEHRYYTGEGAPFAENGLVSSEATMATSRDDFDKLFGELFSPDMRVETRSGRAFPDRSLNDLRAGFEELSTLVTSKQIWISAVTWLSTTLSVARLERKATGADGETYQWSMILVTEHCDGVITSICEFDPDDEDGAFAYAEERKGAAESRLAVTNRASEISMAIVAALQAHDVERLMGYISDRLVYDDRRRLRGIPIGDVREAMSRIMAQYTHFEGRTLAIRGENHHLLWSRWTDDAGNETTHLHVQEFDGRQMVYEGRFDEDDFDGAYREFERRYYAGEGAEFAAAGHTATGLTAAFNNGDFDTAFENFTAPGFHVDNRSRSGFPDRPIEDFRASMDELESMFTEVRTWPSAVRWLSPTWGISRMEREAIGKGGERYSWTRLLAAEIIDGRVTSMCAFEPEDEQAAFGYAEEQMRAAASRLSVVNRASERFELARQASQARDVDAMVDCYVEGFEYDDRRRLRGNPLGDRRSAAEGILAQYTQFDGRTIAVRGERLCLNWTRWRNDEGFETGYLIVHQVDESGRFCYEGRFEEDDFDGAYRELEERYYSGEGAYLGARSTPEIEFTSAVNRGDLDRAFNEFTDPNFSSESRSQAIFAYRSISEFRASVEELQSMVTRMRAWHSATSWPSPTISVSRYEREATGRDGEEYKWTGLNVVETRDDRIMSMCQFDLEDEVAAFAYAEERARAIDTRLALSNSASDRMHALIRAAKVRDVDAMVDCYTEDFIYDDRRKLSGHPLLDLRSTAERILSQYSQFEARILAVRGERLQLGWHRWSNGSGFETTHLTVNETGEDGRFIYEGRFDEDDFVHAYRELDRRYYAGEGAASADGGNLLTEWHVALNQLDFDRVFGELTDAEMRVENRSSSVFGDRTAADIRASVEELDAMVDTSRSWHSAVQWLSPHWVVARLEREAVGPDGERYAWSWLDVYEFRGRLVSACRFDIDDQAAAFTYAEEHMRPA